MPKIVNTHAGLLKVIPQKPFTDALNKKYNTVVCTEITVVINSYLTMHTTNIIEKFVNFVSFQLCLICTDLQSPILVLVRWSL